MADSKEKDRSASPRKSRGPKLSNVLQGFYHKDEINKHYEIKEVLGRGAFSVVKRAVHKNWGGICGKDCVEESSGEEGYD